jgi:hypothetical protein
MRSKSTLQIKTLLLNGIMQPHHDVFTFLPTFPLGFGTDLSQASSSPSPLDLEDSALYFNEYDDKGPVQTPSPLPVSTASSLKTKCDAAPNELGVCYGGSLLGSVYQQCEMRVKGHSRSVVCARHHAFIKCEKCSNVLHNGCWTVDVNLIFILPTKKYPWTCHECLTKTEDAVVAAPFTTTTQTDALDDLQDANHDDDEASKCVKSTFLMTKDELNKQFMKSGWKVRSSDATNKHERIYYRCLSKKCETKFSAREEQPNEWIVTDMPSTHACVSVKAPTGLIEKRCDIPSVVLDKIKELGGGGRHGPIFEGPAIREFIRANYNVLIEVSLIHSICYQAKTLVFGETGDTIALGNQQKVMIAKLMYTVQHPLNQIPTNQLPTTLL